MATTSIYGVPYSDIVVVYLGPALGIGIDPGSFGDDGGNPPSIFTYTVNNGAEHVSGDYGHVTAVATRPTA